MSHPRASQHHNQSQTVLSDLINVVPGLSLHTTLTNDMSMTDTWEKYMMHFHKVWKTCCFILTLYCKWMSITTTCIGNHSCLSMFSSATWSSGLIHDTVEKMLLGRRTCSKQTKVFKEPCGEKVREETPLLLQQRRQQCFRAHLQTCSWGCRQLNTHKIKTPSTELLLF